MECSKCNREIEKTEVFNFSENFSTVTCLECSEKKETNNEITLDK